MRLLEKLAVTLTALSISVAAPAESAFPGKPIRLIVPYAAGSGSDLLARKYVEMISQATDWRIIIDNKAGGNGLIGTRDFLSSPADGHTLLHGGGATHGVNSAAIKDLPYDPVQDFIPIAAAGFTPMLLVVAPGNQEAKTAPELVNSIKANRGKYSYATASSFQRLVSEAFKFENNLDAVNASYRGSGQATTDLIGGHVTYMFVDTTIGLPLVKAGKLKALAVTSDKRLSILPDVPTVAEAGLPPLEMQSWSGIFAPKGTPPHIVETLRKVFESQFRSEAWKQFNDARGSTRDIGDSPEKVVAYIRKDVARAIETFRRAGIQPQ